MIQAKRIAFLGLGVMGFPMAGHLQRAGYKVCVYNRTTAKAKRWVETYGGELALTPADAANSAELVFSCVGNDDDLKQVMLGDHGVIQGLSAGAHVVDHSSTSASVAREMAAAFKPNGNGFIDAPVSGGQAGAEQGVLTVMCGGEETVFATVQKVMSHYARSIRLIGGHGAGQLAKMVNQVCIAGLVQGLAEGLHFARRAELDVEAVIEVISQGAAQSWQMENRYQTMLSDHYDHGFAVDWMRKDLNNVLQEARSNGAQLPVTALVDQFYAELQASGGGRWDTSSLLKRLQTTMPEGNKSSL